MYHARNFFIMPFIIAKGIEHLVTFFYQTWQNIVYICNGKGIICTVSLTGTFQTSTTAMPRLFFKIPLSAKQDKLTIRSARQQHHQCFGLRKTRQVIKVTIGAKGIICVTIAHFLTGGRQNSNRIIAHHAH